MTFAQSGLSLETSRARALRRLGPLDERLERVVVPLARLAKGTAERSPSLIVPGTEVRFAFARSILYSAISELPPIRIVVPAASHSIISLSWAVTMVVSRCLLVIAGCPGRRRR